MIKKIAVSAAALIILAVGTVLAMAAAKPDDFRVVRSIAVKAPPEAVVALIHDLQAWRTWSPYETKDPAMKRTYSGPGSGKGAVYAWDGNGEVGAGRMEVMETTPSKVVIKLDFERPFEAHNIVEFTAQAQPDVTQVTWAMHGGSLPLMAKVVHVVFDMDRMVGKDFEDGLASLKRLAEK